MTYLLGLPKLLQALVQPVPGFARCLLNLARLGLNLHIGCGRGQRIINRAYTWCAVRSLETWRL